MKQLSELEEKIKTTRVISIQDSLLKTRVMYTGKLKSSLNKLDKMVNQNIIRVKFMDTYSNEIWERTYAGCSTDDVINHVRFMGYINGKEFKILELLKTNTRDSMKKL